MDIVCKMSKVILNFDDVDVKKGTFHNFKCVIDINKADTKKNNLIKFHVIKKVLNTLFDIKYFTGYKNDEKVSHYV